MTQEINRRISELCSAIAKEEDRPKFWKMVTELNQLLEMKDKKLEAKAEEQKQKSA